MNEHAPREKTILVHSDTFFEGVRPYPSLEIIAANLGRFLKAYQDRGAKIHRIDASVKDPDQTADLYIIGNDVSSKRALEVINPGDYIFLAGMYRDVCIAMVYERAREKGAEVEIIPGTYLHQDKIMEWDEPHYLEMLQQETVELAKKLAELEKKNKKSLFAHVKQMLKF